MEIELKILTYIVSFFLFMSQFAIIGAIFTVISDKVLKKMRPEIFIQMENLEKELKKLRRERHKALCEIAELKKQMKQFTYTQPKTDHNVYVKKNDYQV